MKHSTTLLLVITLVLAAANSCKLQDKTDTGKPNILFIMSDDHTSQAFGVYGSRLAALDPTPNIDRIAHEGMLYRDLAQV